MTPELLLTLGGVFCIGGVIFHLAFWKIFDWKNDLAKLNYTNRQVMPILNICLTLIFFFFAVLSLFYQPDMLQSRIGNLLIFFIAFFIFFRIALQFIYFPPVRNSLIFSGVLLIGGVFYGWLSVMLL